MEPFEDSLTLIKGECYMDDDCIGEDIQIESEVLINALNDDIEEQQQMDFQYAPMYKFETNSTGHSEFMNIKIDNGNNTQTPKEQNNSTSPNVQQGINVSQPRIIQFKPLVNTSVVNPSGQQVKIFRMAPPGSTGSIPDNVPRLVRTTMTGISQHGPVKVIRFSALPQSCNTTSNTMPSSSISGAIAANYNNQRFRILPSPIQSTSTSQLNSNIAASGNVFQSKTPMLGHTTVFNSNLGAAPQINNQNQPQQQPFSRPNLQQNTGRLHVIEKKQTIYNINKQIFQTNPYSSSSTSLSSMNYKPYNVFDGDNEELGSGTGIRKAVDEFDDDDEDDLIGMNVGIVNQAMITGYKSSGLRKYSKSVCEKVKEKMVTSYNEVADELVHEYAMEHPLIPQDQLLYHQKNIRRRVYDALNVLMAMQIIAKEKKDIVWQGLPMNSLQECLRLETERDTRLARIKLKMEETQKGILELIAFRNLISRNRYRAVVEINSNSCYDETSGQLLSQRGGLVHMSAKDKVTLPVFVIATDKCAMVQCNVSEDRRNFQLTFDRAFEVLSTKDLIHRMVLDLHLGSDQCSEREYERCLELVPPSLRFYVIAMYERREPITIDFEQVRYRHNQKSRLLAASNGNNSIVTNSINDTRSKNPYKTSLFNNKQSESLRSRLLCGYRDPTSKLAATSVASTVTPGVTSTANKLRQSLNIHNISMLRKPYQVINNNTNVSKASSEVSDMLPQSGISMISDKHKIHPNTISSVSIINSPMLYAAAASSIDSHVFNVANEVDAI